MSSLIGPSKAGKSLSTREKEVLRYIADGYTNQDIADELGVTVETVKTHVKHILAKLSAKTRAQAVSRGLARGEL